MKVWDTIVSLLVFMTRVSHLDDHFARVTNQGHTHVIFYVSDRI